jgi:hypothetical protein
MSEDGDAAVIDVDGKPKIISTIDLEAKFKIVALDQSSTPLSQALKRNNIVQLLPVLLQLGVNPATIKDELIRLFEMPDSFKEAMEQAQQMGQQMPTAEGVQTQAGEIDAQGNLPSQQFANAINQGRL